MAGHGEPKASERRIEAVDRQRQALELKKAGVDYRTIASRLGYGGPSGAHKAVMTALKALVQEPAEALRTLELSRIDTMLLGVWPRARSGDDAAIATVLRLMERRARLLGLDAPQKRELTGSIELRTYAERVAADLGLEPAEVIAQAERIIAEAAV